ncbi:MAG: sigma-54-dependent transcriptional regulator [Bacteroidota bacterium]
MMKSRILIVDDEKEIRESLSSVLRAGGYEVDTAPNGAEGFQKVLERNFDVLVTDLDIPEMKDLELVDKVASVSPCTTIMIITPYASIETAVEALRHGAYDYLIKPFEFDEVLMRLKRLREHKQLMMETQLLRQEVHREYDFEHIVGKSHAIEQVFQMIRQVAPTDSTVLITGKSGTGKELVARAIHFNSPRSQRPFIAVNCSAIVENLFESALFGHKRGPFTGATLDNEGLFKAAEGGSLFLDEVSEVPLHLQAKLLRAIECQEITPVGLSLPFCANVRIIAATSGDLRAHVERGTFREDLLHRLDVVEIRLPSLADRVDDIPLIAQHFVEKYRKIIKKPVKAISTEAIRILRNYQWKGEVRELENVVERAMIFSEGEYIDPCDLPADIQVSARQESAFRGSTLKDVIREFEKRYITEQLILHRGRREETARTLKIGLSSLYRKIDDLGIVDS